MKKYSPYKKLEKKTLLREISDKKVIWPFYEKTMSHGKVGLRLLEKKDVDYVSELWRECYGELYGSSLKYDWVLYSEQYQNHVAFKENWEKDSEEKDFCMLLFENVEKNEIIGAWALWKDNRNLQIEFSLGIIHPEYRKDNQEIKIVSNVDDYIKTLEEQSGAEYFTAFCETWHNKTQFLCFKRWGFKIAGIFPGQFTRWNEEQNEYRTCEIHFYKFIGDAERFVTKPNDWELLPEFEKLWDVLEEINRSSEKLY
jgi:hypothetical protein